MKVITLDFMKKFYNRLANIFAKKSEVLTGGSQTTTSSTDGGVNVYTFSDGSTISVKNGSRGSTGPQGPKGATGATGPAGPTNLANNLTTTGTGYALDARQGKALNDSINYLKQWKTTLTRVNLNATTTIRIDSPHEYYEPNDCYVFTKDIIEISIVSAGYNIGVHMTLGRVYRSNGKLTADGLNTSQVTFEIDDKGRLGISLSSHYNAYFIMRHNNGITQIASTV